MKYMILLATAAQLLLCSCRNEYPSAPPDPEYTEGDIVYVNLTRWDGINRNDSSEVKRLWDAMHVMTCVQGIVNREQPVIYLEYVSAQGVKTDRFWYEKFREPGRWLSGRNVITLYDPVKVADMFRDKFNGLVVYDSDVASTSCIASTVAGIENLIAVRYDTTPGSMYTRLIAHGYEPKVWLVGEDGKSIFHNKLEPYKWAVDNYLKTGRCNPHFAAYYPDQYWRIRNKNSSLNHHQLTNHDFFLSQKAFFFDLSPWGDEPATDAPEMPAGADLDMMKAILLEIYNQNGGSGFCHIGGFPCWAFKYTNHSDIGGRHEPVATEWEYTRIISAYNAYQDADALSFGAVANCSFWQHFPLDKKYTQKWVTHDELKAKGYIGADGKVDRTRKYYLMCIGDYDAAAGVYQYGPVYWEDSARGSVPMMWTIDPALEYRVPHILSYFWDTASDNDFFAAGDNGAGYLNPGMLETPRGISGLPDAVDAWAAYNKPLFERWGLSVTGFVIDGYAPGMSQRGFEAYASFSPNGIVPQKTSGRVQLVAGMPVLASEGSASSEDPASAARDIVAYFQSGHPTFPFYWFRCTFKKPSWFVQLRDIVKKQNPNAVYMSGPEFFELLRCYAEENDGYVAK